MKRFLLAIALCGITGSVPAQNKYTPSASMIDARKQFQDMKFGLFIHWGVFSIPGDGEWVMNNRKLVSTSTHT